MRAFMIIKSIGGIPIINTTDPMGAAYTPCHGWVHCAHYQDWTLYLLSGTGPQLLAIAALPATRVVPLCLVSTNESDRFPELRDTVLAATRTKLNTWATARGLPTIPAGATYLQILNTIAKRLNPDFAVESHDVADIL